MAPLNEVEAEDGQEEEEDCSSAEGNTKDGWLHLMDGNIRKRVLAAGKGAKPEVKQDVRCSVEVRLANAAEDCVLQRHANVRYRIGEGEAVPCLELGLRYMQEGEQSEIFGVSRMAWGPTGLPAASADEHSLPADADVLLRVVLHECFGGEGVEPTWNERIQEVAWRKDSGNDHFRRRKFQQAARSYAAGLEVFQGQFEAPEELPGADAAAAAAASLAADLGANLAAAHLEMGANVAARDAAAAALQLRPDHVKSLFRAAKACFLLDEFEECDAALERALQLEPENAAVKRLQAEFKRKKQRYAGKSKRLAANMFQELQYPDHIERPRKEEEEELGVVGEAWAWLRARWRYALGAALCCALAVALCAVLPRRLWPYVFISLTVGFPCLAAVAAVRSTPAEDDVAAAAKKRR